MKLWRLIAGALLVTLCAAELKAQSIRVGIIGDQTSSPDLAASYSTLKKGVELLRRQNVSALLHTGDLIESTRSEDQVRADFQQAIAILDSLGQPWHLTPGDHDVNAAPFKQGSLDRSRESVYKDLYSAYEPGLTESLDHSFTIGTYHFIALNSQRRLHADPRWGNVFLAQVTEPQLRWLAKDLENHRSARAIVVFLHQPLWYNWGDWIKVHELLRKYPVAAVIAGHFHYSQDEGSLDGIRYVVAGAAGGITKSSNSRGATVPQVMVMSLEGRNAAFKLLAIDDGGAVPLMPRAAMDRLQAVDVAAGQMDLEASSQVCIRDNVLYSDYAKRLPPKLSISRIGNPVDAPMRIHIEPVSPGLLLKNPEFTAGACVTVDAGDCILRPGDRVAFSNNSSVQLDNRSKPLPVLWSSEIGFSEAVPKVGEAIRLNVRLSFDSSAGELLVNHLTSDLVEDCLP